MAACLVASAFMTMPVLAQTSTAPAGSQSGGAMSQQASSGRFVTQQQTSQWRASKLIGLNVYGADNDKIGDINEVLVDRQGNADAVVLGVGGFLGIGEKNVALPFSAFEWVMDDTRRTASAGGSNANRSGNAGTAGTAGSSGTMAGTGTAGTGAAGTSGAGTAGSGPAATGSTAGTSGTAGSTAGSSSGNRSASEDRGYPDHAVLRMTKADLQNAPTFRYVGDRSDDRSNTGASGSGSSGAARPATGTGAGSGTAQ
jgi:hypothetical protein